MVGELWVRAEATRSIGFWGGGLGFGLGVGFVEGEGNGDGGFGEGFMFCVISSYLILLYFWGGDC